MESILAVVALLLFGALMIQKPSSNYSLILLVVALGWMASSVRVHQLHTKRDLIESFHEKDIFFQGIFHSIQQTEYGWKGKCELNQLNGASIPPNIFLTVFGKKNMPTEQDTVNGMGELKKLNSVRNPGEFNFKSFYERQHIFGRIFLDKEKPIQIRSGSPKSNHLSIKKVQTSIRTTIQSSTDSTTAGLLLALILGDKSTIDENLKNDFAETGVIHVLAVSGLHVGYILIILSILTSMLSIPWGWNKLVIILGLIFFCFLTGLKPSVIRASMMAALYILSPVINRPASVWNIIGFVAIFLLLIEPLYITDLGFILSFAAVISIIYFYNLFERILPNQINPKFIQNSGIKFVWGLFLVSLSAQIGTLPITAYYFHKIPIISLIANVIIVPIIGVIVVIGFIILGCSFSPQLASIAGESAWFFQKVISWFAEFFSSFKYSSIPVQKVDSVDVALYGFLISGLFLIFQKAYRGKGIISFLLLMNLGVFTTITAPKTQILFMDVGQGDAALVQYSNGKTMLIDAGNRNRREDWGERVVIPVLNHLGVNKLDWVMMSHPHADHIGGLVSLVEEIPADTLIDTYAGYGSWTYNHLVERYTELGTIIKRPKIGEITQISPLEAIRYFAPDSASSTHHHNVNNASIVCQLLIGEKTILFTGDLEHEGDEDLIRFGDKLKSDILKVGHHGSITSTTPQILSLIQPEMAVVSVGHGNKFSHPSPIVMDRLMKQNITIHRTDQSGALWLSSDGNEFKVKSWR